MGGSDPFLPRRAAPVAPAEPLLIYGADLAMIKSLALLVSLGHFSFFGG